MATHDISGLPAKADVADPLVARILARRAVRIRARAGSRPDSYELSLHPEGDGGSAYRPRPGRADTAYYDPRLARLEPLDPDEPDSRLLAMARPGLHQSPCLDPDEGGSGGGLVYRGMSHEEFEGFLQSGEVRSLGECNMAGQDGLTYWSTSPESAAHYACGFAPMEYKPTFERPAYVVAARRPQQVRAVSGTAEHEVGVVGAVSAGEVVAVWRGDVYSFDPGSLSLAPDERGRLRLGSQVACRADVVWSRLPEEAWRPQVCVVPPRP